MTPSAEVLQPLRFVLRGSRLIEASAGTGKTYTIAALYLRLVLGHGGEAGFHRALVPPEILVVTFTDAATQELRDRIRARLAEAAEAFLAEPSQASHQPPGQDVLHDLRAETPPEQWPACARRLRLAAEWMDEAAVSTIHGWCHRMLREHAFDSGHLFSQALQADQRELLAEAVRDHWRTHVAPLAEAQARQWRQWWATPEALLEPVQALLPLADRLPAGQPPALALPQAQAEAAAQLQALKGPWAGDDGWAMVLLAGLDSACAAKQVKMPSRRDWMHKLRAWAEGDAVAPNLTDTAWGRFAPGVLAATWQGDARFLAHPAWAALALLRARLAALPDGRDTALAHAVHSVQQRLQAEQLRRAEMGFNELLTRLDAALQGPNGQRLAALIRRQFPVAMIDEFQDTDPLQYRIFDTVYGVAANDPATALVLIGDPKQAIYAFRGADIHTYLRARADTAGRQATLGTNFRSTQAMVAAVNRVFLQAETRPQGEGAFLFRSAGPQSLPFVPVAARGRPERWCVAGRPAPALVCWTPDDDRVWGKGAAQTLLAQGCASEIVRLLQAGAGGQAGFERDGTLRGVQPGDMAVLVNSGREAAEVRQALRERGVRSVYLSDKDSVFQSPVAADLQRWLQACAEPDDDRLLRAALGSATLALPWAELDQLNHDENAWEQRVLQFRALRERWRRQGVLPMLRHLMQAFGVSQRLLAQADERGLTDLLHLAELLQQASVLLAGEHALIRWLAEQRADESGDVDSRKLRLESDADLVKVVTVHKSKGLEYPLVFLPFASHFRSTKPGDLPLRWHDDDGDLQVSLRPDDEAVARAEQDRLGEDLRKLYVALTRARHATWLGVVALKQGERSALGYLLGGGQPLAPAELREALRGWCGAAAVDEVVVQPVPAPDPTRYEAPDSAPVWAPEPPLPAGPRTAWWVASYSALRRADELDADLAGTPGWRPDDPAGGGPATAGEDIYADSREATPAGDAAASIWASASASATGLLAEPAAEPAVEPGNALATELAVPAPAQNGQPADAAAAHALHDFPRGAAPGTFLHQLLEWAGRQGFARLAQQAEVQDDADDLIARRCNLSGWPQWTAPLRAWLHHWVRTPLDLQRLQPGLAPVAPAALASAQVEMEFWLAASTVDTLALDRLVTRHTLGGVARPALQRQQLNGMLKGYIDLVFEHQGHYFIADHKSNWLGATDAHYHPEALRQAVLQHRYELQYVLYTLALHRLLKTRLPGYDYDRHVGGVVYLFLRGHAAPGQGLHLDKPARALVEALDALLAGRPMTEASA